MTVLQQLIKPLVSAKAVDFWAAEFGSTWTWQRPMARIVDRWVEGKSTVTLLLKPNRHFQGFKAGQHINVTVDVKGARLTRSYSLSDKPHEDGHLCITVKKEGRVSRHLCEQAQIGDVLELGQAFGELALPEFGACLLLAAGSGITPMMSLIRQAAANNFPQAITLVYWAKTRADVCFAAELKTLAEKHSRFKVYFALTEDLAGAANELQGRISIELLNGVVDEPAHVLACGGAGFVANARQLLQVSALSFQAEAFSAPVVDAGAAAGVVRVELANSGKVLELNSGASLLDALEAQGIYPPSGCRMGVCHTCSCKKLSGTTQDMQSAELSTEPGAAVRLCTSRAHSDLVLAL